jgi:hypothetical protein
MIDAILRHPFALLVLGALLTSLIAPWITSNWQLRQKRLEIKTTLVTEMSELVVRFVMAIQFVQLRSKSFSQGEFDNAYLEWEVGSAVLGTKLEAYLGLESRIPPEWTRFAETTTSFYALAGTPPDRLDKARSDLVARLQSDLPKTEPAWRDLRDALLAQKAKIIRDLMDAKIRISA